MQVKATASKTEPNLGKPLRLETYTLLFALFATFIKSGSRRLHIVDIKKGLNVVDKYLIVNKMNLNSCSQKTSVIIKNELC